MRINLKGANRLHLENSRAYRCCCCCHVRTGTIFLGIWHMFMNMLVLSMIGVMMFHPNVFLAPKDSQVHIIPVDEVVDEVMSPQESTVINSSDPYAQVDDAYSLDLLAYGIDRKWSIQDAHLGLVLTACTFFITTLMCYGAVKGHPGYLMPFFCLQVFDFCVTLLSIVGYCSYLPVLKQKLMENVMFRDELARIDDQWFGAFVMVACALVVSLKAYMMGVVWSCYKYLCQRRLLLANNVDGVTHFLDVDSEALLPPMYDDVLEMKKSEIPDCPPPAYAP
ncbi:PREDICTED: lysosomal-associated transmembrane protein 4A-like [Priapulus caudatus]|uniref:Lysosomal-associated transmembrane protein 4A-like n=1 Tax=Priapulus caudatus TaxID=37621 RepID=A0ABM1E5I2_PRICU|nr:PREDICTED: lysosomal-associated transmembrane protein 4A-like [Priapulus caudatus]